MNGFNYAELERRVAALENSQTASLRFGRVTGVEGGKSRVQLEDGQGMNSMLVSTLQKRVKQDQDICMPDTNEPVAVLFAGNGCEQAIVLGAYYNGTENDPGQPQHMDYKRYSDGTELWYDREAHKLVAKVKGDCEIEAEKTIRAKAREDVEIESQTQIILKAPEVIIKGNLTIEGNITMQGADGGKNATSLKGDLAVDGNVDVNGAIVANSITERG